MINGNDKPKLEQSRGHCKIEWILQRNRNETPQEGENASKCLPPEWVDLFDRQFWLHQSHTRKHAKKTKKKKMQWDFLVLCRWFFFSASSKSIRASKFSTVTQRDGPDAEPFPNTRERSEVPLLEGRSRVGRAILFFRLLYAYFGRGGWILLGESRGGRVEKKSVGQSPQLIGRSAPL